MSPSWTLPVEKKGVVFICLVLLFHGIVLIRAARLPVVGDRNQKHTLLSSVEDL